MSTVTMGTPERSIEQRNAALKEANRIRTARKKLKLQICDSHDLAPLLDAPPEYLRTAKVYDFMLAVPKWGPSRAQKTLSRNHVSLCKTFDGLTDRQRAALVVAVSVTPKRRKPASPKRPRVRRTCWGCGIRMREPSESGLCGFCQESR